MPALPLIAAALGFVLPLNMPAARSTARMGVVDEFVISKDIKDVRVFDGDYAKEICDEVAEVGVSCIAEKGSFSLMIPGGSVVAALSNLDKKALDWEKVHIFLANEKIPSLPCIAGALEKAEELGIPTANVYGFGDGSPAEVAESYSSLLSSHPSIDNEGPIPSVDMILLGTGPDGHVGCVFPDSPEIKATGTGKVVLAGNDERADGDFVAVSMDVMCAAQFVLVSAAGAGRAPMITTALSGDFGAYDCPAGCVEGREQTLWFTTADAVAPFQQEMEEMEDTEDESE